MVPDPLNGVTPARLDQLAQHRRLVLIKAIANSSIAGRLLLPNGNTNIRAGVHLAVGAKYTTEHIGFRQKYCGAGTKRRSAVSASSLDSEQIDRRTLRSTLGACRMRADDHGVRSAAAVLHHFTMHLGVHSRVKHGFYDCKSELLSKAQNKNGAERCERWQRMPVDAVCRLRIRRWPCNWLRVQIDPAKNYGCKRLDRIDLFGWALRGRATR